VGEWLKPTDCKSVPPSEVRRFESSPVHQNFVNRLAAALIAYVVVGILTWTTISDQRIRGVTLLILAMFAVKSWLRRKDVLHPDGGNDGDRV
jgi:heme A synthase